MKIKSEQDGWSLGLLMGRSPFELKPLTTVKNPFLTANDISDVDASIVADPFAVFWQNQWHLFFEIKPKVGGIGVIGVAVSEDACQWHYQGVVLAEPFHLSYPFVFAHQGAIYMMPETLGAHEVRIYRARNFPHDWVLEKPLFAGQYADPSLLFFKEKWWLFACGRPYQHDRLNLFWADSLFGDWQSHECSPLVDSDPRVARPAGRPVVYRNRPVRFAQVCQPRYGTAVSAFEISQLNEREYQEREVALTPAIGASGTGWNRIGMHHLDLHCLPNGQWLAFTDGNGVFGM